MQNVTHLLVVPSLIQGQKSRIFWTFAELSMSHPVEARLVKPLKVKSNNSPFRPAERPPFQLAPSPFPRPPPPPTPTRGRASALPGPPLAMLHEDGCSHHREDETDHLGPRGGSVTFRRSACPRRSPVVRWTFNERMDVRGSFWTFKGDSLEGAFSF